MKVYRWILCLALVAVISVCFVRFGNFQSDEATVQKENASAALPEETAPAVTEFTFDSASYTTHLMTMINAYRANRNLAAWTVDPNLSLAAETRATECSILGSKSHTRPDGSEWFSVLQIPENHNYSEITGKSGHVADDLLRSWISSETLNNSLLSPTYTTCGIGSAAIGGDVYCVLILYQP